MALTILDTVSEPGSAKPNEDRIGHSPNAAWVLDGATDVYPETFLPAHNDVHYLVDRLGEFLADRTAGLGAEDIAEATADLRAEVGLGVGFDSSENDDVEVSAKNGETAGSASHKLLEALSDALRQDLAAQGFPADRTHPTCSLGLAIDHGDTLELARIGDTTLIVTGDQPTELFTTFYNQREAAAVDAAGPAGLTTDDARAALLRRRQEYITGSHPEGVFSGHPDAHLRIHSRILPWQGAHHVLLCTDGFARAITDYHLFPDWPTLINAALADSLTAIAKAIRDIEQRPDTATAGAHFKRSDDLAAVLCERG